MERRDRIFLLDGLVAWSTIFVLAMLIGAFRELAVVPFTGKFWGLIIGGLLLALVITLVARIYIRITGGPKHALMAWVEGGLWVILTIAAEFALFVGYYGQPAMHVIWNFDPRGILAGNLMVPVMIYTFFAPYIWWKLRKWET